MEDRLIQVLKELALMGAIDEYVSLSSSEFGKDMGMSQQSASKKILELLEEKLIVRNLGARKQRIKITEKGVEVLRGEYNEYRHIFETIDHVLIRGKVATGMGEGGFYICQEGYMRQFKEKLGFTPYFGTLNVQMDLDDIGKMDSVLRTDGERIEGFTQDGRTFGDVVAYRARIRSIECAIVVPEKSHYIDTLEIICPCHLRRTLSLEDGDPLEVRVALKAHKE